MKTASIFDYSPPVKDLPKEPMPKLVPMAKRKNGVIVWGSRERKKCL